MTQLDKIYIEQSKHLGIEIHPHEIKEVEIRNEINKKGGNEKMGGSTNNNSNNSMPKRR